MLTLIRTEKIYLLFLLINYQSTQFAFITATGTAKPLQKKLENFLH